MTQTFKRTIEDFVCERCGAENAGNGYTNHCFKCLWSKHVDVNPGDRAETCGGMMCPAGIEHEKGKMYILHRCEKCGVLRRKAFEKRDDFAAAIEVAENRKS